MVEITSGSSFGNGEKIVAVYLGGSTIQCPEGQIEATKIAAMKMLGRMKGVPDTDTTLISAKLD